MAAMTDEDLVVSARAGDATARKSLTERGGLRMARAVLGTAVERAALVKELVRAEGPVPGLGALLAASAGDEGGEVKRTAESLARASSERWGPPERIAIGRFAAAAASKLGADLALELLESAARFPGDVSDYVRAAVVATADLPTDAWDRMSWKRGFEELVLREPDAGARWSAQPLPAQAVAKALLAAQARGQVSAVAPLDAIWKRTPDREAWSKALGEQLGQHRGMSAQEPILAWGWELFCDAFAGERTAEVAALYQAFRGWRDLWIERRNATPKARRPGGESAVAHLALWAGLDLEQLSTVVDESARLARDSEWRVLVDSTFDLAEAAAVPSRRHAYAGACRISHEVTNRVRGEQSTPGLEDAANQLIVRSEQACANLRDSGAVIDQIVANRVEDLETNVRLIRETRERARTHAERDRERAERDAQRAAQVEAQRRAQEESMRRAAEHAREAEEARTLAHAQLAQQLAGPPRMPPTAAEPDLPVMAIDLEIRFPALLSAATLLGYARFFKQLTSGGDLMAVLAAEGLTVEMMGVISQTWSQLFTTRADLAMRFSALISATWS